MPTNSGQSIAKIDVVNTLMIAAFAVVYYFLAKFCLNYATINHQSSPVWLPSALGLFIVARFGPRAVAAILAGAFAANYMDNSLASIGTALAIATGNCIEATIGSRLLILSEKQRVRLGGMTDAFALVIASVIAPLASAGIGTATLILAGKVALSLSTDVWLTWYIGDASAILAFAPVLFALIEDFKKPNFRNADSLRKSASTLAKVAFSVTLVSICSYLILTSVTGHNYLFALFPLMLIPTWFVGRIGATLAVSTISLIAVYSTVAGTGPFLWESLNVSLLATQLLVISMAIVGQFIAGFATQLPVKEFVAPLLIGWTMAGIVYHSFNTSRIEKDKSLFIAHVDKAEQALTDRIKAYADALQGGVGFFNGSQYVDPEEWRDYVDALSLHKRYPGINGLGFIEEVRRDDTAEYEKNRNKTGQSGFQIHPVKTTAPDSRLIPNDPSLFVIKYIEPLSTNTAALGLDIGSEHNRRAAAELARDTGEITTTSTIYLVQDNQKRAGFLMYAPFFKKLAPTKSIEDRRLAFRGLVYAPFVFEKLIKSISLLNTGETSFEVYDGEAALNEKLIYSSYSASPSPSATPNEGSKSREASVQFLSLDDSITRTFTYGQKKTTIVWRKGPAFKSIRDLVLPLTCMALAGLVLLLTWIYVNVLTSAFRTEALIAEKTKALSTSEKIWRTLMESAPVGIYQTDANGACTYVNPKWEEMTGLSQEQAQGHGWMGTLHPDDRQKLYADWRAFAEGGKQFCSEYRFVRPDGCTVWAEGVAVSFKDDSGVITGFMGVNTDISARKHHEAQLNKERGQAYENAKMASLGQMAGGIAHEINNPLAIISGYATQIGMLAETRMTPEKIKAVSEKMIVTVKRIARIVSGLRTISRNATGDPMLPHPLKRLIEETLELCLERFRQNDVSLKVSGDLDAQVSCRPSQIGQVILNLLLNAYDAVAGTQNPWVHIEVLTNDSAKLVTISVTDSGHGIPPEIAAKIMEPFFTTKEVGKGTGLGLSLSLTLVEENGGKFWLDSSSMNTRFVMEFPLAQELAKVA